MFTRYEWDFSNDRYSSPYLEDKRQVIWMFMSVPRRSTDSHFYYDASDTPYITAATIALSTQHLSRDKPTSITCKRSWIVPLFFRLDLRTKVLSVQGDGAEEALNCSTSVVSWGAVQRKKNNRPRFLAPPPSPTSFLSPLSRCSQQTEPLEQAKEVPPVPYFLSSFVKLSTVQHEQPKSILWLISKHFSNSEVTSFFEQESHTYLWSHKGDRSKQLPLEFTSASDLGC